MAKKRVKKGKTDKRTWAFLATFLTVIGVVLVLILNKRDKYTMHYTKQGMVLFLFWIVAVVFGWIPFIGWAVWVLFIVVWIMAWVNALSGEMRLTWLVSEFSEKIKL
jgi:uncharacterized membrane protein